MIEAWKEPTAEDVTKLMSAVVTSRADVDGSKIQGILMLAVQRVRAAAGRHSVVSDNANEVPPEGLQHTLILAIHLLLSGTPNFQFLIRGPDGSESGFGYSVKQAERWIDRISDGMSVTYPSNPNTNSHIAIVRSGGEEEVDTEAA